jgi:hypothetical protein
MKLVPADLTLKAGDGTKRYWRKLSKKPAGTAFVTALKAKPAGSWGVKN